MADGHGSEIANPRIGACIGVRVGAWIGAPPGQDTELCSLQPNVGRALQAWQTTALEHGLAR